MCLLRLSFRACFFPSLATLPAFGWMETGSADSAGIAATAVESSWRSNATWLGASAAMTLGWRWRRALAQRQPPPSKDQMLPLQDPSVDFEEMGSGAATTRAPAATTGSAENAMSTRCRGTKTSTAIAPSDTPTAVDQSTTRTEGNRPSTNTSIHSVSPRTLTEKASCGPAVAGRTNRSGQPSGADRIGIYSDPSATPETPRQFECVDPGRPTSRRSRPSAVRECRHTARCRPTARRGPAAVIPRRNNPTFGAFAAHDILDQRTTNFRLQRRGPGVADLRRHDGRPSDICPCCLT